MADYLVLIMSVRDVLISNNEWWYGDFFRTYRFRRWHYYKLKSIIESGDSISILFLGMRRTGKTVVLKQLVSDLCEELGNIAVYIPVDELVLRAGKNAIVDSVEWFLRNVHPGGKPVVVVLDEAQYYADWSLGVKVIFDKLVHRTKVFFVVSGSSSLGIIMGAGEGLVGRSKMIRLYPMGLLEIIGLLHQKPEISRQISTLIKSYYGALVFEEKPQVTIDNLLVKLGVRSLDIDRAFGIMVLNGSLPQTVEMLRRGENALEVMERLLEIVDLTIMRDILRLLKKYPSKYELDPWEAQAIIHIIAYNSPYLASTNSISTSLGISWRKVDLAIKLGSLAGIITVANNYAKSPEIRERKRLRKYLITDVGLRNAIRHRLDPRRITDEEQGRILENLILAQLQKVVHILGDPNPKVYLWRMNRKEIDAVAVFRNNLMGLEIKKKKRRTNLDYFKNYVKENVRTQLIDEEKAKEWLLI